MPTYVMKCPCCGRANDVVGQVRVFCYYCSYALDIPNLTQPMKEETNMDKTVSQKKYYHTAAAYDNPRLLTNYEEAERVAVARVNKNLDEVVYIVEVVKIVRRVNPVVVEEFKG